MGKIPNNAKKVFEGILFDVYHWEQEMFDGTFETFEKVVRIPSSQIFVITPDKKIILLNEEQPQIGKFIGLPGGMVERNENPQENAKKELLEELGMKAKDVKLWKKISKGGKIEWNTYYFIAKDCEIVQKPQLESGEKIEPIEVDFDEFVNKVLDKNFRNKDFGNLIFKMKHTPGELEKFKKEILE